jgi:hypothetical protein
MGSGEFWTGQRGSVPRLIPVLAEGSRRKPEPRSSMRTITRRCTFFSSVLDILLHRALHASNNQSITRGNFGAEAIIVTTNHVFLVHVVH